MDAIRAQHVSIRYMTGDFKDIGLKEYLIRRITGKYKAQEFWADRDISFTVEKGDMLALSEPMGRENLHCSKPFRASCCPRKEALRCMERLRPCWS